MKAILVGRRSFKTKEGKTALQAFVVANSKKVDGQLAMGPLFVTEFVEGYEDLVIGAMYDADFDQGGYLQDFALISMPESAALPSKAEKAG